MSNFGYLENNRQFEMFSKACIEAEKIYATSPSMCAIGCRKALELAVKWVYAADSTMEMPYRDNLSSLIYEESFRYELDPNTWNKLRIIVQTGNRAVHTEQAVSKGVAVCCLKALFEFIQWIEYCYGDEYEQRTFDIKKIPDKEVIIDEKKIREQEGLIDQKDAEIQELQKKLEEMSAQLTAEKEAHIQTRTFVPDDLSEFKTRKIYIDTDLEDMGWVLEGVNADVAFEYEVDNMGGILGRKGYCDYVLFGKDGLPLAVIEAKKASKDPNVGRQQAVLYADCLERKFGRRPMMFTTNGFETYFWDDLTSPQRKVSQIFSKDDLQKLMNRRQEKKNLYSIQIDDKITDRYYQKEAIRAVCDNISKGGRKNLLVMATGTGKTRTASSLTDVLSRAGYITNVLFLADRTALVAQAKDDFKNYLPDMSLCNLCSNKDDLNARIVFSTYPTMLNAIDNSRNDDGLPMFTPAHFDLIIIDESHRSIFHKYKTIFDYFDAILVGLTATPRTDVDKNTYSFFDLEVNVPTYAYDYETAVYEDHVLVPYYTYETKMKFLEEGITYDDLDEKDRQKYEDDFAEDDYIPDFIPSSKLNKFVFNADTVDVVLQDLMERGIKTEGGDRIGKSIIFAQNKKHAEFIVERFNKLYPQYHGKWASRVVCEDSYAQTIIDDFKKPASPPYIVVSVDMMDTGIDVPECVNLVFFKKVRSKTKFWQMIGRGTRLCKGLQCIDEIDGTYIDKRRFIIFDYCSNFEFFRETPNGYEATKVKSLTESIFEKKIRLAMVLQDSAFAEDKFQNWRNEIITECHSQVNNLDDALIAVRLNRQYVQKYKNKDSFTVLNDIDKEDLTNYIAPLVYDPEQDEAAKRFDNLMYGLMLADMEQLPSFSTAKKQLCNLSSQLEKKITVPQIKARLPLIKEVQSDAFWNANDLLAIENVRKELRYLIRFLWNDTEPEKIIKTDLKDIILEEREGDILTPAYEFEDYKEKVNKYISQHSDDLVIHKLKHNIPLTSSDYEELDRIFTNELGTKEDYQREYGETPFGLLIRKISKLDHSAAMEAFSEFINDQGLNQRQIVFINKVINYVELNGYIDNITELQKPPFDKPVNFIRLFDPETRTKLVNTINSIKKNAMV